jgi:hypothetical protein
LLVLLIFSGVPVSAQIEEYISSVMSFREQREDDFRNGPTSPLKPKERVQFSGLSWFEVNPDYNVTAKLTLTPDEKPFEMPSFGNLKPNEYVKYGILTFTLGGKKFKLAAYRSTKQAGSSVGKNYLLVPFSDPTNGNETFYGGRYIDLLIPDSDRVSLDFNLSYTPDFAYNAELPRPMPPDENFISIRIEAGETFSENRVERKRIVKEKNAKNDSKKKVENEKESNRKKSDKTNNEKVETEAVKKKSDKKEPETTETRAKKSDKKESEIAEKKEKEAKRKETETAKKNNNDENKDKKKKDEKKADKDRKPSSGRFADFNGVKVRYQSFGKGDEALIFVHGWTCNSDFWKAQFNLYGNRRVIAIDLPGHGESDKPETDYTMDFFAESIKAVMDEADVKRAVLVGHSMGTPVIRQFYRLYPKKVLGLIIVDGSLRSGTKEQVEEFMTPLRTDYAKASVEFVDGMLQPIRDEKLKQEIRAAMLATPNYVGLSAMEGMINEKIWTNDKIDVPVLAILAESPWWKADEKEFFASIAPKLDFRMWQGVSHFLMMEKPLQFSQSVRFYLNKNKFLIDLTEP